MIKQRVLRITEVVVLGTLITRIIHTVESFTTMNMPLILGRGKLADIIFQILSSTVALLIPVAILMAIYRYVTGRCIEKYPQAERRLIAGILVLFYEIKTLITLPIVLFDLAYMTYTMPDFKNMNIVIISRSMVIVFNIIGFLIAYVLIRKGLMHATPDKGSSRQKFYKHPLFIRHGLPVSFGLLISMLLSELESITGNIVTNALIIKAPIFEAEMIKEGLFFALVVLVVYGGLYILLKSNNHEGTNATENYLYGGVILLVGISAYIIYSPMLVIGLIYSLVTISENIYFNHSVTLNMIGLVYTGITALVGYKLIKLGAVTTNAEMDIEHW